MSLRVLLLVILGLLLAALTPVSCPTDRPRRSIRRPQRGNTIPDDGSESASADSGEEESPFEEPPQSRPPSRRRRSRQSRRQASQSSRRTLSPPRSPPPEEATRASVTAAPPHGRRSISSGEEEVMPLAVSRLLRVGGEASLLGRQVRRVLRQEPPSETTSTHEVWGVQIEAPECFEALHLSFPT